MTVSAQDAARTLRRRASRQRTERRRRAEAAREQLASRLPSLLPRETRVWLIGSLAWGGFGPRSDIDLVVDDLSEADAAQLEAALGAIEGAPVEVLRLAELPAGFRARVEREGTRLDGR